METTRKTVTKITQKVVIRDNNNLSEREIDFFGRPTKKDIEAECKKVCGKSFVALSDREKSKQTFEISVADLVKYGKKVETTDNDIAESEEE